MIKESRKPQKFLDLSVSKSQESLLKTLSKDKLDPVVPSRMREPTFGKQPRE